MKYKRDASLIVKLFNGDALMKYQNIKNFNFDIITLIEVIEHIEENQLGKLEENVFGFLKPKIVIISTPNSDFNVFFENDKKYFLCEI